MSHDGNPYEDVDASRLLEDQEFVFSDMLFSGYYQFRVMAYFEGVASEPVETDYFVNGVTGIIPMYSEWMLCLLCDR